MKEFTPLRTVLTPAQLAARYTLQRLTSQDWQSPQACRAGLELLTGLAEGRLVLAPATDMLTLESAREVFEKAFGYINPPRSGGGYAHSEVDARWIGFLRGLHAAGKYDAGEIH